MEEEDCDDDNIRGVLEVGREHLHNVSWRGEGRRGLLLWKLTLLMMVMMKIVADAEEELDRSHPRMDQRGVSMVGTLLFIFPLRIQFENITEVQEKINGDRKGGLWIFP